MVISFHNAPHIGYYRECVSNCTGVNGSAIPRSMMHMGPRKWGFNPNPKFMSMPEEARKRGDIKPQQKGETDEAYKQRVAKEAEIKNKYIDMASDSDDYWLTLLPFSIFLGFLGFLSLVFLELGINDYCTWLVPKLGPKELDPEDETITAMALYTHANEVSRKNWLLYFSIAMVVAVFGTNFVWYGNYMFDSGFKQFDTSLDSIGDRLFAMSTDVTELNDKLSMSVQLATTASQTTCPGAAATLPNMAKLGTFLAAFADQVAMIASFSDKVHDNLYTYNDYKNKVLYSVYFVASAMLLSFFVIFWFRKQEYMRYTIYVSQAGMVILLALAVLEFMGMMYISDFCMDPTVNVVESLTGMGLIQQTAKYYGTCRGLNPIHRNLASAYSLRDVVGKQLVNLFSKLVNSNAPCVNDRTTEDAFRALQNVHSNYEALAVQMDCQGIHDTWTNIFEFAVCTATMKGMVGLWVAGIVTALGLFVVALTSSVLMLYFDDFWRLQEIMEGKVDHIREQNQNSALLSDSEDGTDSVSTNDKANVRV